MPESDDLDKLAWLVLTSGTISDEIKFVGYLPQTPFVHGLDPKTAEMIDVVWHCLHLPRGPLDCFEILPSHLKSLRDIGNFHKIAITSIDQLRKGTLKPIRLGLVVAPDLLVEETRFLTTDWHILLGVAGSSEIQSQAALDRLWQAVAAMAGSRGTRRLAPRLTPLSRGASEKLSLAFRARHYIDPGERPRDRQQANSVQVIVEALELEQHASALVVVQKADATPEEQQRIYAETLKSTLSYWPLVVGALGAPQTLLKLSKSPSNQPPEGEITASPAEESRALELLLAHCAIGQQSFGLRLADITYELFTELENLERVVGSSRHARKIQNSLRSIGRRIAGKLSKAQHAAIAYSSSVTAFTDFPLGLTILDGDTSPLACRMPISYRPLTPLTTALDLEFGRSPEPYALDGLSILIAECLSKDDPLYSLSLESWKRTAEAINALKNDKFSCSVREFDALDQLQRAINSEHIDLLIISAHGVDDKTGLLAGIRIGQECVFELGTQLPKFVMFSSCSVWRRGNGATSIADLALRRGAHAVLGTLFPVRADHNAVVVERILLYVCAVMEGTYPGPGSTLRDAVYWALSTNSFFDIVYGSKRWREWFYQSGPNGELAPIAELLRTNPQRLRPGHIYEDAENILCDMAAERATDRGKSLRNYLASASYVPESLFYVLIGRPERILLRTPDIGTE